MTPTVSRETTRFSAERIFLAGLLAAVNLAIACSFLAPLRNRPVWDLRQLYFAGKLVREGKVSSVYDRSVYPPLVAELSKEDERAAKNDYYYFIRPAFEAPFCLPLAYFSFRRAMLIAVVGNVLLLAVLIWKLPKWLNAPWHTRIWLIAFLPFLHSIAFGQDTLLMTLLVAYGFHLAMMGKDAAGGGALALAGFKPHLILAVPMALAVDKKWRLLSSFLVAGAVLALSSFALIGPQGVRQYVALLQAPSSDGTPVSMGNLRALWLQFGWPAGAVAAAIALACFIVILRRREFTDQFAAALIVSLLLSPHTYPQDYSLLAIVALLHRGKVLRYLTLLPWPYFYSRHDMIPFVLLALALLIAAALQPSVIAMTDRIRNRLQERFDESHPLRIAASAGVERK